MSEILHSQLETFLKESVGRPFPDVYLIHGQEMLVEKCTEQLVVELLDGQSPDLCCEKIEGVAENLTDALERLNTFSLLSNTKIVLFKETKLFEGRGNPQRLVKQIADAWNNADSGDHVEILRQAIERGFAQHHYLIATVYSKVPKNLKLYKSFQEHGVVIDCNIPLGERRSDKAAQEAVLRDTMNALLAKAGKRLSPRAFQSLCRLTGFDLRTFVQNVEKLIDYTGDRAEMTEEDIRAVLRRTKVDPVFELTNAAADRNLIQALFFLKTLLDAGWHPLQILAALANQMRKLLIAKSFATSEYGKCWTRGMTYPQFQRTVMPAIEAHDQQLREQNTDWLEKSAQKSKKAKNGGKGASDVVLAVNPKSAYPVYQTLLKADKYTPQELVNAMARLNQADLQLKSTGQDAAMILKKTLMGICGPKNG